MIRKDQRQKSNIKNAPKMTSWKNVHVIFALLVLTESEEITRLKKKTKNNQNYGWGFAILYLASRKPIKSLESCWNYPPNIYLFRVNNKNTKKGVKYVQS